MWNKAEKFLSRDKYIGPLIKKYGRCTIKLRSHQDYFEHLCGSIIGQQLSGKVADVIETRFKKAVGGKVGPDAVLKTPDQKLRDCGMSLSKVSFLKDLAARTKNGDLKIKKLDKLSDEEVINELVAVKGIGRWTAEMFLMFSLARPDIFPTGDLGIKKAMAKLHLKKSDRWKPYRTVASWYLWRILENR